MTNTFASLVDAHDPQKKMNLGRLLAPRHVAFVGGQNNVPAIEMLRSAGFRGEFWPVHPTRREIAGFPVFQSVADLPEGPDAAFLNVPNSAIPGVVTQLVERGGGGAVCYSAGYAELGDEGRRAQVELSRIAGSYALVGPNANGILNNLDRLALWPAQSHVPRPMDSGIAIVSSSGGILFNYAINQRSVRSAVMIATGNQAVLTVSDYIGYLLDDPRITAIGLFSEDIGDPVRFGNIIAGSNHREIPIVALKTGKTAQSAELAATHSGAMVARDDMITALFARTGVIRVDSLPEFDETLKMLTVPAPPRGRKTALLTVNGGEKALAVDTAAGLALEFSPPAVENVVRLKELIPEFASVSNPFDFNPHYTGTNVLAMDNEESLTRCFETFLADEYNIAILLVAIRPNPDGTPSSRPELFTPSIDAFTSVCRKLDLTGVVSCTMPEHLPYNQREKLTDLGIAPLMGLPETMRAIDHAIHWHDWKSRNQAAPLGLPKDPAPPASASLLDEAEAKSALASLGLSVPPSRIVTSAGEAGAAAEDLGFPVVLKVLKPVFAHKMKQGAVALNLRSRDEVIAAANTMRGRLNAAGHSIQQMLVEKMVTSARSEIIVGVKYEPRFGHALMLGVGGVNTEEFAAPDVLLLPAADAALEHFVLNARVLHNESLSTRKAVYSAVRAVSEYCAANRERLRGLDVNPLIVAGDGTVTAVDALIQQAE